MRTSRISAAVVGVTAVALLVGPLRVLAATSGTGTDTLTVSGGSLSVASVGSAILQRHPEQRHGDHGRHQPQRRHLR